MMKARQYDRRFLTRDIQPNFYSIQESNNIDSNTVEYFANGDDGLKSDINLILTDYKDAKEYGSIIQVDSVDFDALFRRFEIIKEDINICKEAALNQLLPLVQVAKVMSGKYAVVATNPPYLNKFDANLKTFVTENYKDYYGDLFSIFIYRNFGFCKTGGYSGFMTPFVWMFIKSYEKLRNYVLKDKSITTLIQFEYSAFEEATVPICSFVLKNGKANCNGYYFRLSEFVGGMEIQRIKVKEALDNKECGYYFETSQSNFNRIPGNTIAYWLNNNTLTAFENKPLEGFAKPRQGMATSDNNRFLRMWFEVDLSKTCFDAESTDQAKESGKKWFPYNKGGDFRKWYGNNYYLINWENDGREVKDLAVSLYKCVTRTIKNIQFYFQEGVTWTTLSSGSLSARYSQPGFLFDTKGSTCYFDNKEYINYTLGFLNSSVVNALLQAIAPTLDYNAGSLAKLPIAYDKGKAQRIDLLVKEAIAISKEDWDSFEISWDFKQHPFIRNTNLIEEAYEKWADECQARFYALKEHEEEINRLFIEIYNLQNDVSCIVDDKAITVSKADKKRDVRSFLSYIVGCLMGRYSVDQGMDGVIYSGGGIINEDNYNTVPVDKDGIIPVCDDEYFSDDLSASVISFIKMVYGNESLEENLKFIADALGGTGTSREIIRNYFVNDFYSDHVKAYQKRPIYWLFDSGKKNGFKCLLYMHRYQPDMLARIRTGYVHEQQSRYRTAIEETENRLLSASGSDKVKLDKKIKKLREQDTEIHAYEEKVHHLADQMISIDLDDGVKVNYAKFQDVLAKIK
jgi:hypothetical protein